ncbi:hypothetical protein GUJ93_ZPchr0006g43677 [Zizania palustris]|uniref:Uncharacterized protein n=1 Tax=Zizania palustris TaxID=103762 RepID=A0A8J5T7B3_ZIZPA|nr:hypothetical protein GUJ93_ZPchr0006g43677 [Zizania palustris]
MKTDGDMASVRDEMVVVIMLAVVTEVLHVRCGDVGRMRWWGDALVISCLPGDDDLLLFSLVGSCDWRRPTYRPCGAPLPASLMICRAAPWSRLSLSGGCPFLDSARPRGPFGGVNVWRNSILKNSWALGGMPIKLGLPSRLFRCTASSSSGDGAFSQPTSTDEVPMTLYSWPDKQCREGAEDK